MLAQLSEIQRPLLVEAGVDPGGFDGDVEIESFEKAADPGQAGVGMRPQIHLAHPVVLEVDHPSPERRGVVDPEEGGMGAEGEVIVDLIAIAEYFHVRKIRFPGQKLAGDALGQGANRVGNRRGGIRRGVPGLEVHVAKDDRGRGLAPGPERQNPDAPVGGASGLDQTESQAQAPLVEVALEAVKGADLGETSGGPRRPEPGG